LQHAVSQLGGHHQFSSRTGCSSWSCCSHCRV
jgi:hypothetical protein